MMNKFLCFMIMFITSLLVGCEDNVADLTTGGASHENDYSGECNVFYDRDYRVYPSYTKVGYLDSISSDTLNNVRPSPSFNENANPGRLSLELIADVDPETVKPGFSSIVKTGFSVDIFGCETHECPEATKVIVHNSDYTYDRIIYPSDFKISKYQRDVSISKRGIVQYSFHLTVKFQDISLSWDILTWESTSKQCPAPLKPAW